MYNIIPEDTDDFHDLYLNGRESDLLPQGIINEDNKSPSLSISPQKGDLILFRGAMVHGVTTLVEGHRSTLCSHLGIIDPQTPIQIFI